MFYTYLLTNQNQDVLFGGRCDDLIRRIYEHKLGRQIGRASPYAIDRLVWFEVHETRKAAVKREQDIKSWPREWRLALVQNSNPHWKDLSNGLTKASIEESLIHAKAAHQCANTLPSLHITAPSQDAYHTEFALAS